MKKYLIFLVVMLIMAVMLYVVTSVFVNTKGKDIIITSIKNNLGVEATLEPLVFKLPFNVEIKNFKCADIFVRKADVSFGFYNPFASRLVLNKIFIEGFKGRITRNEEGITFGPFPLSFKEGNPPEAGDSSQVGKIIASQDFEAALSEEREVDQSWISHEKEASSITSECPLKEAGMFSGGVAKAGGVALQIKDIYLQDGCIEFWDITGDKPFTISFEGFNLKLNNFVYPELTKFHVNVMASVKKDAWVSKESVTIGGWVDYFNRDMDVSCNIGSISYAAFKEYYPSSWKPENLGIKEAYLSLGTRLNSQQNILVADNILFLEEVSFLEGEDQSSRRDFVRTIIALVKGNKEKASYRFIVNTKMDAPVINFSSLKDDFRGSLSIGPAILADEAIDRTKEAISAGVSDVTEATVDTAVDTIKSTLGTIKEIFKTREQAQEQEPEDIKPME